LVEADTPYPLQPNNDAEEDAADSNEPDARWSERLLPEQVVTAPLEVLNEIFTCRDVASLKQDMWEWLQAAIANNNSACEEGNLRMALMTLYTDLVTLCEALHVFYLQHYLPTKDRSSKKINTPLMQDMSNPMDIVDNFCKTYTPSRTRFLLWHWLDAGISYPGTSYSEGVQRSHLLWLYEHVHCLMEAAFILPIQRPLL
jgi:hypothetical protein